MAWLHMLPISTVSNNPFLFPRRFVVRSRSLFSKLNGGRGREPFQERMAEVLESLCDLMRRASPDLQTGQGFCLKNMVLSIPDLESVFDRKALAEIIVRMVQNIPQGHLEEKKMTTLRELVHSQLFAYLDCRAVMMPEIAARVSQTLAEEGTSSNLKASATRTLGDTLDALHSLEGARPGSTLEDVTVLASKTLRTVIKSVANRKRGEDAASRAVVSNMIGLLRAMTPRHYERYIDGFGAAGGNLAGRQDLLDFVMEVLGMFTDLMQNKVFPPDWSAMILLQNSILLQALRHFANTIWDFLKEPFEFQAWRHFFQCAVTFITQPSLQLEKFSESKREGIRDNFGDMRKDMGMVVKSMWFNLGGQKIRFVPDMVGPVLEMTLVPEAELRKAALPIFFDMMQCEYYSSRHRTEGGEPAYDTRRDAALSKGHFRDFERELIGKIDGMFEAGGGDSHYRANFNQIMLSLCKDHTALNKSGEALVDTVSRQMDHLLAYRAAVDERDNVEGQMSCAHNLFQFYQDIGADELYLKYLKKLCALHEQCGNFAESACTLLQYAEQLTWTDRPLRASGVWERHSGCKTHRALKERLYRDAVVNFEKGQMWERALALLKELAAQYEEETFEYAKLGDLHSRMAGLYKSVMSELRPDPEYYRVAFWGRGFPSYLQNRVFVYRGRGFEMLSEFQGRILDQFPNAELMRTLAAPAEEEKERPVQLLQICKVDAVMSEKATDRFRGRAVHRQIFNHFKSNEVSQFVFSRPFAKDKGKRDNEFANLWIERTVLQTASSFPGVLQWFPLASPEETFELCPLENAVEAMAKTNEDLRALILEHQDQTPPLHPLSMKLNGIVDAAVMGGTANYERAFFAENYLDDNPDHLDLVRVLKNHIAEQIPLLEAGIRIHDYKKSDDLKPMHDKIEQKFALHKRDVEEKYGKRPSEITVRRVGGGAGQRARKIADAKKASHAMTDSRLSLHPAASTTDLRASFATQPSLEVAATPKSRVLSAIGITRRKSNVSPAAASAGAANHRTSGEENRTSLPRQTQSATHLENGNGSLMSDEEGDGASSGGDIRGSVVVTQTPVCRLAPSTAGLVRPKSRPTSGQFGGLQHQQSRSPSIASVRLSAQDIDVDGEAIGGGGAPPVPPKMSRGTSSGQSDQDSVSLSSVDEEKLVEREEVTPTRHVIVAGKKKAPPPPPPPAGSTTPPTPPRKPTMRQASND